MTEMVERVAKVIGDHYDGHADPNDTPRVWASAMEAARAAIEAMREPTEAMVDAAVKAQKAGLSPRNMLYDAIDTALGAKQ